MKTASSIVGFTVAVMVAGACDAFASDFATEVVAYDHGINASPLHRDPAQALGRPTVDSYDTRGDFDPSETAPVVPVFPPSQSNQIVSIGRDGYLTVKFDHDVEDDSDNPYGLDFLVFGNAFQLKDGSTVWVNRDPASIQLASGLGGNEPGRVSVSQDGSTWHTFTNGPWADTFAPTLGRVYDTNNPDAGVGAWNEWWGDPTDPTRPHDPAVSNTQYNGMTLADMCRAYRTSAGGTGFDLADLEGLPVSPTNGLKWFRYVRIEGNGNQPEVDAVSDVAPVSAYEQWRIAHFSWWDLADENVSGDAADPGGSGRGNLVNYLMGLDPLLATPAGDFVSLTVRTDGGTNGIAAVYDRAAAVPGGTLTVEAVADLTADPWTTNGVVQEWDVGTVTGGIQRVTAFVPGTNSGVFLRLKAELTDP